MTIAKTKTLTRPSDVEVQRAERRAEAEASLVSFIQLVHPHRLLANIHKEVIEWWTAPDAKSHQLLLMPRDHGKSAMIAYRAVWALTKDPTLRIMYISSTSNLATKQLKFIKDILTSDTYRLYWPEMVNQDETQREKWTEKEISVDHPRRKAESIREPSIFTAGLTTNVVGLHCDIAILDDVVVAENAYTESEREKVKVRYGYLSSVEGADAKEWTVGTRYHPNDLYSIFINGMESEQYDDEGNLLGVDSLYDVREYQVESAGDGTGQFLWPRSKRPDGKEFGFNARILATKRNQYQNRMHFRAQYYNDPHDSESAQINNFQYYDANLVNRKGGVWFYKDRRLNVVAAVDFAYSMSKKADYTCIVTVGVDHDQNYYVLDIDRFKTDQPSEYYKRILFAFEKWGFRKIRMETTAAQAPIVNSFKEAYVRPLGLSLSIDEFRPSKFQGSKEERILAVLEPKYANGQMWHYRTGNCQLLEEELMFANPQHDDIKDALASAVDLLQGMSPSNMNMFRFMKQVSQPFIYNSRWGGVA